MVETGEQWYSNFKESKFKTSSPISISVGVHYQYITDSTTTVTIVSSKHFSELINLVTSISRICKTVMSDPEINQEANINIESNNSNEPSSNSKTSSANISYPPPPSSSGSDNDYDGYDDYYEEDYNDHDYDDYNDHVDDFDQDFNEYNDYGGELDEYDPYDADDDYLSCSVCEAKIALGCSSCSLSYCRQHVIQNVRLAIKALGDDKDSCPFISYVCNKCLKRTDDVSEEWRGKRILTLEMLCAFNIARKMWEKIYADEKWRQSYKLAMGKSLSLMSSVDQLYADSPSIVKKLIKRAVFLLGLELDFYDSIKSNNPGLGGMLNGTLHTSDEDICHDESDSDDKDCPDNGKNDDAGKSDNAANDKIDCWEYHKIEWTPQFTVKQLDDRGV